MERDRGDLPLGAEMHLDERRQLGEDGRMKRGEMGADAGHRATLGLPRARARALEPCPSRGEWGEPSSEESSRSKLVCRTSTAACGEFCECNSQDMVL